MNGGGSTASEATAAQRLQEKHEADAAHRTIIEDVVDEEDIAHPPPSMFIASETDPAPVSAMPNKSLSDKAAGKQKAKDELSTASTEKGSNGTVPLDTQSVEAFPALGSGPKAPTPAPAAMAWGAKKPSTVNAETNGANGKKTATSMASSRASTPTPGVLTPTSPGISKAPQSRGISIPNYLAMPGRHSERVQFAPSQLLPRDQLKKPLQEVLRGINKRSKANVEMKTGPNGVFFFEGTGPVDATRQALKDLAKEVGSKVKLLIVLPW